MQHRAQQRKAIDDIEKQIEAKFSLMVESQSSKPRPHGDRRRE